MAEDQGKKEDLFGFTPEGESLGYISLEQARVVAMRTAREHPGNYGRRLLGVRMVFDLVEQEEGDDYYIITLSFRPEGDFSGAPGREQFFIEKEGTIADRQVLSLPSGAARRRFPLIPVAIGLVAVAIIAVGAGVVILGGGDSPEPPGVLDAPTATSQPAATEAPTRPRATSTVADRPETRTVPTTVVVVAEATRAPAARVERPPSTCASLAPDIEYAGEIFNDTVSSSADIYAAFSQAGCFITGFFSIDSDSLAGSGPLEGQLGPVKPEGITPIMFTVPGETNDIGIDLVFQAELFEGKLNGRFQVPATGEEGRWYLRTESGPTPTPLPPFEDDHGDSIETNTYVSSPSIGGVISIDGVINPPDDRDVFGFFAEAGDVYIIEVELGSHPDTFLTLLDYEGQVLEENDDTEGLGNGSGITLSVPFTADFFLEVRSYDSDTDTGSYTLFLSLKEGQASLIDGMEPMEFVTEFWPGVVSAETLALQYLDPSYAASFEVGEPLRNVEEYVANLAEQGLYEEATFDWASWHVPDVRLIDESVIEVDSCEVWSSEYYNVANDDLVGSDPPHQLPQTVTIERLGTNWFITNIVFHDPPHFCPLLINGMEPGEFVTSFLTDAILAEITAYERLDPSYAAEFYAGETLQIVEESVAFLSKQGWYLVAKLDWDSWYHRDVRVISDTVLEVDDCETWTNSYYTLGSDAFVSSDGATLMPSTFLIERLGTEWFLTDIEFFDPPHFC